MSCDEPVALFMHESIIVRDSFGSCGHVCFPLPKFQASRERHIAELPRRMVLSCVSVDLFMCHKREMMEHFYSKIGRSHRSLNPVYRTHNISREMLPPDDVIIYHDDQILDEGNILYTMTPKCNISFAGLISRLINYTPRIRIQ